MITFPQHAGEEMLKDGISKEEAEACLEHGELVIKQVVSGNVLRSQKEKMANEMKEGFVYCAKCDSEMRLALLSSYEYLESHPLSNVQAYKCPQCGNVFFSDKQAADMEQRTKALVESTFGFRRKITVTGRSLAVTIPQELASYLNLSKGVTVKIIPSTGGLTIRKVKA